MRGYTAKSVAQPDVNRDSLFDYLDINIQQLELWLVIVLHNWGPDSRCTACVIFRFYLRNLLHR